MLDKAPAPLPDRRPIELKPRCHNFILCPSAQASTMRARSANACAVLRRAASARSSSRSLSLSRKNGNCRLAIDPPG